MAKLTILNEDMFNLLIIDKLETFREYAQIIENKFKEKLDEHEANIKKIEGNEVDDYIDFYLDDMTNLNNDFPNILRRSLLISIVSFLEAELIQLYKIEDTKKFNEPKGSVLKKIAIYAKKEQKKDFPNDTKEWSYIQRVYKLRNCIVHNEGYISRANNPTEVKDAIKELLYVSEQSTGIKLEKEFCFEFIEVAKIFLLDIRLALLKESPQV
ncbi:hypothetical protein [Bacillus velezensis]|uniref:hypothetical protein n=1 Tax=Bacillus velezensis TaxID=492670 RepID=UPI002E1A6935|nr:hypothetical protein [Bacillus velezensis]